MTTSFRRAHIAMLSIWGVALALTAPTANAWAAPQTAAITYQGLLKSGGAAISGGVDLQFKLFDAAAGGNQIGSTLAANAVTVSDGVFTASLDFGALAFNGEQRWLEVSVASPAGGGIGPFTTLAPRQAVASAPYAAFALQSALSGTYGDAINLTNAANTFVGSFTGSGAGLTSLSSAALTGTISSGNIGGAYSNAVTFSNAGNSFTGSHSGDGSALGNLNASNISGGTLNIARLPTSGTWSLSSLTLQRSLVGNINPTLTLQQTGAASASAIRYLNSVGNHFNMGMTAAGDLGIGYNANPGLAGDLLRMTPTGSLGLGTLTPVNRLDVEGGAAIGATYAGTNTGPANGLIVEGNVGIGVTAPLAKLHATSSDIAVQGTSSSTTGRGVFGQNTAVTGDAYGVFGQTASATGRGVYGLASSATGVSVAGKFDNNSTSGFGVVGLSGSLTGPTTGVLGQSNSSSGYAVLGIATATSGLPVAGRFEIDTGAQGVGVWGYASGTTGVNWAVSGDNFSTSGMAVFGRAHATSGATYGVFGRSDSTNGYGVFGNATATTGQNYAGRFEAESTSGRGVFGVALATTGATYGGRFESMSTGGRGVLGYATATTGITEGVVGQASSIDGAGVFGLCTANSNLNYGVFGRSDSDVGIGVYGESNDHIGVAGYANATTGFNYGVYGETSSTVGRAVFARAIAASGARYGVYGEATSAGGGVAVYANGNMAASGTKPFRIDHPDDPANKYLLHYAAESPEVINFYSGKVTLNGAGEAIVELPLYFAKINKDPRYSLTAIGAAMPNLHVAEEVDENALLLGERAKPGELAAPCWFRIAGGAPGMKVSWEVKAVRNDRYVQQYGAPVEVAKQDPERGTYQHPELYDQPATRGLGYMPAQKAKPRLANIDEHAPVVQTIAHDGPVSQREDVKAVIEHSR